jgi:pilus assembly protein CpaB
MAVRLGVFIFFVVALIAVAILGYSIMGNQNKAYQPPPPATEQVLTAADQMNAGALVQPSDVGSATIFQKDAPPGTIIDTSDHRAALIGSMILVTTVAGAPLLEDHLLHPGEHGFLAAVLHPGMRAVTINVTDTMNANGLVWPGDHVDVIVTEPMQSSGGSGTSAVSEVLLSNVRVIATGKQLQGGGGSNNGTGPSVASPDSNTMTFEVTPDDALKVAVTQASIGSGQFSLAVHSAAPETADDVPSSSSMTMGQAIPQLEPAAPATPPTISQVQVITSSSSATQFNF